MTTISMGTNLILRPLRILEDEIDLSRFPTLKRRNDEGKLPLQVIWGHAFTRKPIWQGQFEIVWRQTTSISSHLAAAKQSRYCQPS